MIAFSAAGVLGLCMPSVLGSGGDLVIEKIPPTIAPNIRSGKKIPPGAPDPKLTAENRNFTRNVMIATFRFRSDVYE